MRIHLRWVCGVVLPWVLIAAQNTLAASASPAAVARLIEPTPLFRKFAVAEGLPSSFVMDLAEDKQGFLWAATNDGLARYDGTGFRVYRHDSADPASISGDAISTIYVDRLNRIWCGVESHGLDMLDSERKGFVHYVNDPQNPSSLTNADVWSILEDDAGKMLLGIDGNGLDRFDPAAASPKFVHFPRKEDRSDSLTSGRIFTLYMDNAKRLWVGGDSGLDVGNIEKGFAHVDFSAVRADEGPLNVRKIAADKDGRVLIASSSGLLRVDEDLKAAVVAAGELTDKVVYNFAHDAVGDLWIGTQSGLDRITPEGKTWRYAANPYLAGGISENRIEALLRDHEDNFWFATYGGGLLQLPPFWRNFTLYRHDPGNAQSLSAGQVQGLSIDAQGGLWAVNLAGGIDRIDPILGTVERYGERLPVPPSKSLYAIEKDRSGRLWLGHATGVRIYRIEDGSFEDLPVDPGRPDTLVDEVNAFVETPTGTMWATAFARWVYRIEMPARRITRFEFKEKTARLNNAGINQIGVDPAGAVLVASSAGLERYDEDTGKFSPLPGIPERNVASFAFARDGSLWLLLDDALERYCPPGRCAATATLNERYTQSDGWPSGTFNSIQVDDAGRVWASSTRGLWRYDPLARQLRHYDAQDGLVDSEFNNSSDMLRTPNGNIFGATSAGIIGFAPERIGENTAPPPLELEDITVRRAGRDSALDAGTSALTLAWNDRDLRIRAAALSYANPAGNRYQWKMSDVDADWFDTGNRGEREYSQLPPGRHTLELRAANASGVWSPTRSLRFDQPAPPWATGWAFTGYALIALLAAWSALRNYRARLLRRHALALAEQQRHFAEAASAAKTEFLATMGHEIRTPMTGVLGMTELLLHTPLDARQRGYAETIQTSGQMLLRMVNDSLDLARIEAGKLELEDAPVDPRALVEEVAALARPLAEKKGLAFERTIAADVPRCVRGDAVRIKQIVLNLANNAIKFTERGRVAIELARAAAGGIEIRVCDSGPGIAESMRARLFQRFEQARGTQRRHGGSGLGLAICRELVARMGGEIALNSEEGIGSTFRVLLPLREIADAQTPECAARGAAAKPEARANLRIVLVEDDATVAAVIAGLLETQGHRVHRVGHGLAALTEIESVPCDLALLDLDLPGLDGYGLARALRAREAQQHLPRLPLIGISARSVGDEEALCQQAGMDAFLRKPIAATALRACIDSAVVSMP
jgi:signal transduction histidine kinase/sugar lactone lactonase YvrE/ActR/RegA family two-component response regulator